MAGSTKVTGLKTIPQDNVRSHAGHSKWLFTKLPADQRIVGLAERPKGGISNLKSPIDLLHDMCELFMMGRSPWYVSRILHDLYAALHDCRHPNPDGVVGTVGDRDGALGHHLLGTWPADLQLAERRASREAARFGLQMEQVPGG